MDQIQNIVRKTATSNILQIMNSPERSTELLTSLRSLSDSTLNAMAEIDGIPEDQYSIFRAHMRGEPNPFLEEVSKVDGNLQAGDVILMTGKALRSKGLVSLQIPFYINAKSSHVALVHADFICIDAMHGSGVSNRLIHDVLSDVEDDWRVIRFVGMQDSHTEIFMRACSYYLAQPYKIKPSRRSGKNFAYCSELARKVYQDCGLTNAGINTGPIVAPAHFDKLADHNVQWQDVTAEARAYVDVCRKYPAMMKIVSRIFIRGLELNRARFEDRKNLLKQAQLAMSRKLISKDKYIEMVKEVKRIEESLHHHFWDTKKT